MKNKSFFSIMSVMLIWGIIVFCSAGCGGGGSSSNFASNFPEPEYTPNSEEPESNSPNTSISYTVTFDSNGGSEIEEQVIVSGDTVIEPDEPVKDGFTFLRWEDDDGNAFIFGYGISEDIILTAQWAETVYATENEVQALENVSIIGASIESLDSGGALRNIEVKYKLDEFGLVSIFENKNDPMLGVPGLIGNPVEISLAGGKLSEAEIIFQYDPTQLTTTPDDLAIIWYDEASKDIKVFADNSIVDTTNNTLQISTTHFSKYGVVSLTEWQASLAQHLPTVRTAKLHYNIILTIDCSSSMSGSRMTNTITSAKNLVDSITDDDYISIIAFEYSAKEILGRTKVNSSNRQAIKDKIGALYASGGTNFDAALKKALEYHVDEVDSASLIILLSDGESSVSSSTLEELKNKSIRVITIGLGMSSYYSSGKTLLERIASETGGNYLDASVDNVQDKFSEIAEYDLGSFNDNDNDGIPDIVEQVGTRDQYGNIISTDQANKDTDGDGITDGEEMGMYENSTVNSYSRFIRKSNPRKYTHKVNEYMLTLPNSMQHSFTDGNKMLISIQMLSILYKETATEDFIFRPIEANELKVELTSIPDGFKIEKDVQITSQEIAEGILITASALLSYNKNKVTELDSVQWKIGTDGGNMYVENLHDFGGIPVPSVEKTQSIASQQHKEVQIDNALYQSVREAMAEVEKYFLEKFSNEIETEDNKANSDSELQTRLASVMSNIKTTSGGSVHEDISQAFGLAIAEAYDPDGSKVRKYSSQPGKLTQEIANEIIKAHKKGDKYVTVNKVRYRVHYDFWSMSQMTGINSGYGSSTIYTVDDWWNERQVAMLMWTSSMEENAQALASYSARLAELNKDVWNEFMASYFATAFDLLEIKTIDEKAIKEIFDTSEKLIKALCGDKNASNELVDKLKGFVKDKLTSNPFFLFEKNKFTEFVEKHFTQGTKIINAAKKIKTTKEKFDKFKGEMEAWSIFQNEDKKKNTYEAFKTAYDELEKFDIESFTNATNFKWPEFF